MADETMRGEYPSQGQRAAVCNSQWDRRNVKESRESRLTERVDSGGLRLSVDREKGVIPGVKILGLSSANGREYLPEALARAAQLYEGKAVNVDHVDPNARRSYADRIGRLAEIQVRADGLFGTLHFNPKHRLAEQLAWDAENAPGNLGLSHDASGRTSRRGKTVIVEEITAVRSVDLVADPATTKGLFESLDLDIEEDEDVADKQETTLQEATIDQIKAKRPEILEAVKREIAESAEAKARDEELKQLREEVASLKADAAKHVRHAKVIEELKAEGFDTDNRTHVSDLFMESLLREEDAAKRKELIDDRKVLVGAAAKNGNAGGPRSASKGGLQEDKYGEKPIEKRVASWSE